MSLRNIMNESKAAQASNTRSYVWADKTAQKKETGQAGEQSIPSKICKGMTLKTKMFERSHATKTNGKQ